MVTNENKCNRKEKGRGSKEGEKKWVAVRMILQHPETREGRHTKAVEKTGRTPESTLPNIMGAEQEFCKHVTEQVGHWGRNKVARWKWGRGEQGATASMVVI